MAGVRLRATSRASARASLAVRAIGFSTSTGRPACAAWTHRAGRWSVGAQTTTIVPRRIAVSASRTASPAIAPGMADGSESHTAASRRSRSEATTPSTSGR